MVIGFVANTSLCDAISILLDILPSDSLCLDRLAPGKPCQHPPWLDSQADQLDKKFRPINEIPAIWWPLQNHLCQALPCMSLARCQMMKSQVFCRSIGLSLATEGRMSNQPCWTHGRRCRTLSIRWGPPQRLIIATGIDLNPVVCPAHIGFLTI